MKLHVTLAGGALLFFAGCASPSRSRVAQGFPISDGYPPDMWVEEARHLTAEECKAIVVARAALEASAKVEIRAHFTVQRVGDDWHVMAFYTPLPGQVTLPGDFTAVIVAHDWSIKEIIGGA